MSTLTHLGAEGSADSQCMTSHDTPRTETAYTPGQLAWRWIATVLVLAASAFVAFWVGVIGLIVTTGCFIECSDPDLRGIRFLVGSAVVLGGGTAINSVWWPRQRTGWLRVGLAFALGALAFLWFVASRPHGA